MTGMDLARLREVAEAATPGPWEVYQTIHAEAWVCEVGRGGFGAVSLPATGRPDYGLANAEHVATFDPPTVLALLDALASRDARLAAVEALAFELALAATERSTITRWAVARRIIRALRSDPDEASTDA